MYYNPSSFPLGEAVATMHVTEKLEMLPAPLPTLVFFFYTPLFT